MYAVYDRTSDEIPIKKIPCIQHIDMVLADPTFEQSKLLEPVLDCSVPLKSFV
jgi:hypothetical protein